VTVSTQLEILDLRHYSAHELRPLLQNEARQWRERLRWDYQSSMELLLQYLDSRILPGFVALDRGRICGFTFCVYEGNKAVIGDAYSMAAEPEQALYCTRLLLDHLLEMLKHSPGVGRIESQMLLYDAGTLADKFRDADFTLYMRLFMELDIDRPGTLPGGSMRALPEYIEIRPWASGYYQAAAELIHASYVNHVDSMINDQYRSLHGSLRFLHNIVRFPGCGVFEPEQSWLMRDKRDSSLVGVILCSRIAHDVAHITQICVSKAYRGQGLGRVLLQQCIAHLRRSGFSAITLTVTEPNAQAVKLYEELGFFVRHRFDAMVYDTTIPQR
jgi:ribosomal protein S18 acetylase RimI-like enzyme